MTREPGFGHRLLVAYLAGCTGLDTGLYAAHHSPFMASAAALSLCLFLAVVIDR